MKGEAGCPSRLSYGNYIVWIASEPFDVGLKPLEGEYLIIESNSRGLAQETTRRNDAEEYCETELMEPLDFWCSQISKSPCSKARNDDLSSACSTTRDPMPLRQTVQRLTSSERSVLLGRLTRYLQADSPRPQDNEGSQGLPSGNR